MEALGSRPLEEQLLAVEHGHVVGHWPRRRPGYRQKRRRCGQPTAEGAQPTAASAMQAGSLLSVSHPSRWRWPVGHRPSAAIRAAPTSDGISTARCNKCSCAVVGPACRSPSDTAQPRDSGCRACCFAPAGVLAADRKTPCQGPAGGRPPKPAMRRKVAAEVAALGK
jgi:hypothetical protein